LPLQIISSQLLFCTVVTYPLVCLSLCQLEPKLWKILGGDNTHSSLISDCFGFWSAVIPSFMNSWFKNFSYNEACQFLIIFAQRTSVLLQRRTTFISSVTFTCKVHENFISHLQSFIMCTVFTEWITYAYQGILVIVT
jgi:hypothetical protein